MVRTAVSQDFVSMIAEELSGGGGYCRRMLDGADRERSHGRTPDHTGTAARGPRSDRALQAAHRQGSTELPENVTLRVTLWKQSITT
jgi:hypothetical protein